MSPATGILACSSDPSPRWRGLGFRQAISSCAALCILQQATGTLADPGRAGSAGSSLTSRCQPCSALLQCTPSRERCPPQGSISSHLPCEDGSPRGGGETGTFNDEGIPHLSSAQTSSLGKAGREARVRQSRRKPTSNEKSQHGKGQAAPPEPNTLGMQLGKHQRCWENAHRCPSQGRRLHGSRVGQTGRAAQTLVSASALH